MIIDISKYQKVNDWNKVKSNVDGVYIGGIMTQLKKLSIAWSQKEWGK